MGARLCRSHQTLAMFDHVVLRRSETGLPVSAGQIAEALLYYQHVHLVIDRGTLETLLRKIGPQRLLSLLRRPDFSALYTEELLATHTESAGAFQMHRFVALTVTGHQSVGTFKTVQARLQHQLESQAFERKTAQSFAKTFTDRVTTRKLSGDHFVQGGIPKAATRDLMDTDYLKLAVRTVLGQVLGGDDPGTSLRFDVIDSDLGLHVFHNIDLDAINRRRAALHPPVEPLTVAYVLNHVLEARADIALASFYGGDFLSSQITSAVVQVRHEELLRRTALNLNSQRQFTEIVLPDMPSLAEVIDGGERSFDEFLLLLDKAGRFKHWLKSVGPDEGLIRTYFDDVTSQSWVQKLPSKTARYILTLAIDATNPTAGLLSGFVDNFVVEKLLGGWRPNHFIAGRLGPFIGG